MAVQLNINTPGKGADGALDLSDKAFGVAFNEALIHQVVTAYLAGGRAGTRAQKNRSAVRGGGRKPWRQKGTGRARSGTIRSPIWRGGGRTFPATTRDFSQKVNRKMYRAAVRSMLSELNRLESLLVVSELDLDAPKTKQLAAMLAGLGVDNALIVVAEESRNLELAARNLPGVSVLTASQIDPVSLIGHEKVIMTVDAAKKIDEALQ